MRYNLAIMRELPLFRAIPYVLELDGTRMETQAMLVAVGNGPSYGGGMRVTPDAEFDDGLLDVLVLHKISTAEFLRVFPTVFKGTHVTHPKVQVLRARTVRLEATGIVSYADGERSSAASTAPSDAVRSTAGLPNHVCAATSMPYAPRPKYTVLR